MPEITAQIKKNIKHLRLLAKQYPTVQSVHTEIINLRAILNLPKGTEHFLSDLHGEYEAFTHILNNCSGVIREKVGDLFGHALDENQCRELCSLIYYPEKKIKQIRENGVRDLDAWYETSLLRMVEVCQSIASKYTRSKVRKAMPADYAYILDELLNADYEGVNQAPYYSKILESILSLRDADNFIVALATLIKRLAVDRLHIVGDIFDRGPRPDLIMDLLEGHHSVDIQWGNHDILWMGAAAGNPACIAAVVCNSAAYGNLQVLEEGYGINLRPLALFADKTYADSSRFFSHIREDSGIYAGDAVLSGKIYKAISIIMFKLEGQLLQRHPEYGMEHRMLLHRISADRKTIAHPDGRTYPLLDTDLPTLLLDPYALTEEEEQVVHMLRASFARSEHLHRHTRLLYAKGSVYKAYNQNLMYHGCVPMEPDGSFSEVEFCGEKASGKALFDLTEEMVRKAYYGQGAEQDCARDAMWYLWCGAHSPFFGRSRMTTFERRFIADKAAWAELEDPYYKHILKREPCERILEEFGLSSQIAHIINGHVPVRAGAGENPVKGEGKLIIIDGGFCKEYQPRTGIAGYTLIYNSYAMRLSAHMPFESIQKAIDENIDIHSITSVFETMSQRMRVMDTDIGQDISEQIYDLSLLLRAHSMGLV